MKRVLKDDYNYDSTVSHHQPSTPVSNPKVRLDAFPFSQPTFYALYRSFTECQFVEDEGDIIFYKNKQGKAAREVLVEEMKWQADNTEVDLESEGVIDVTDKVKET